VAVLCAAGTARSAPVTATHQNPKLNAALTAVKHTRARKPVRHRRAPVAQYPDFYGDFPAGSYPYHEYYGMRAWYAPTATFAYPFTW